uniref:Uncharacterized protein n=1 Tax=Solanum lycopersicum TaxID=4081 RepID=A0A3Q7GGG4_SOLLC
MKYIPAFWEINITIIITTGDHKTINNRDSLQSEKHYASTPGRPPEEKEAAVTAPRHQAASSSGAAPSAITIQPARCQQPRRSQDRDNRWLNKNNYIWM